MGAQLTKEGYASDLDGLVIGEPSNFNVRVTHKGVIDYYVYSKGICVHSSTPEKGQNAIMPLIEFAQAAQQIMDSHQEKDPVLGSFTHVSKAKNLRLVLLYFVQLILIFREMHNELTHS